MAQVTAKQSAVSSAVRRDGPVSRAAAAFRAAGTAAGGGEGAVWVVT